MFAYALAFNPRSKATNIGGSSFFGSCFLLGMKLLFTIWSALISLPMNTVVFCSHLPLLSPKAISFIPCGAKTQKKRNNALSQMRLRSVFKMRMSILNTATTEQIGYSILSFFVYTKSTNQVLKFSSFYHNTDSDCKYYQWNHKYCHNQCCFLVKCRYDCILCF